MLEPFDILALSTALACGILLGSERENRGHAAGLRTLTLISLGSCLFTLAGRWLAEAEAGKLGITMDPGRLASYVIAGIGFLGAGPIITRGITVEGLTTSAAIWISAAIGIVSGVGRPGVAAIATVVVILVLLGLRPLGTWQAGGRRGPYHLALRAHDAFVLQSIEHILTISGVVTDMRISETTTGWEIRFVYRATAQQNHALLVDLQAVRGFEVISERSSHLPDSHQVRKASLDVNRGD